MWILLIINYLFYPFYSDGLKQDLGFEVKLRKVHEEVLNLQFLHGVKILGNFLDYGERGLKAFHFGESCKMTAIMILNNRLFKTQITFSKQGI